MIPNLLNLQDDNRDENGRDQSDLEDGGCQNMCIIDSNKRYVKTDELISKSQYRTIFRGYDNDSGNEIAWCVYILKELSQEQITNMKEMLDEIKSVTHQYILMISHYHVVTCGTAECEYTAQTL